MSVDTHASDIQRLSRQALSDELLCAAARAATDVYSYPDHDPKVCAARDARQLGCVLEVS